MAALKSCLLQNHVSHLILGPVANWVKHRVCLRCLFIGALGSSSQKEMPHFFTWVASFQ